MYINGRWVSMQMANTIFILWAVAGAVLIVAGWWLSRRGSKKKPDRKLDQKVVGRRRHGKRHKR